MYFFIISIRKGKVFFDEIVLVNKLIIANPILNKHNESSSIILSPSSFSSEFINSILRIKSCFKYLQSFFVNIFFLNWATIYMNSAIIDFIFFFKSGFCSNSIVIFVGSSTSLKKLRISNLQSHKVSYTFDITFSSQDFKSLNKKSAKSLKISK